LSVLAQVTDRHASSTSLPRRATWLMVPSVMTNPRGLRMSRHSLAPPRVLRNCSAEKLIINYKEVTPGWLHTQVGTRAE
jgi:proline racemase